ncbi:hypothetical protein GGR58DRAFT_517677 [Xylaria digitata]|nr:hypothetical protein GGR58DRAFT_517677 [Xylaria digitata]
MHNKRLPTYYGHLSCWQLGRTSAALVKIPASGTLGPRPSVIEVCNCMGPFTFGTAFIAIPTQRANAKRECGNIVALLYDLLGIAKKWNIKGLANSRLRLPTDSSIAPIGSSSVWLGGLNSIGDSTLISQSM